MCIRDSFSYQENGREPRASLVGVGVLSLQMCGSGSDSTARRGLDWMLKNTCLLYTSKSPSATVRAAKATRPA